MAISDTTVNGPAGLPELELNWDMPLDGWFDADDREEAEEALTPDIENLIQEDETWLPEADAWLPETEEHPAPVRMARRAPSPASAPVERVRPDLREEWDASFHGRDRDDDEPRGAFYHWKWWLIPVAAALFLAVIMLAVGFTYANRVTRADTIYPNVYINGVNVGGLTQAQAAAALAMSQPDRYADAAVTVNFPTGDTLTVTAQEVGLDQEYDAAGYAARAYAYGRSGTLLQNLKTYRSCGSAPVELPYSEIIPMPDGEALAALVAPVAEEVDGKLAARDPEIGEEEIILVKSSAAHVDVAAVCALIEQAFRAEVYDPIEYELPEGGDEASETDVDAMLQALYDEVFTEPVEAEYDPQTQGATESANGVSFDMEEAKRLWNEAEPGQEVVIPLIVTEPEITSETLAARLFADVLSEKSTSLSGSSSARINNIDLAAQAMNGTVLNPGDEFDYNTCLGQRTEARGYQGAGAYENGQHVTTVGGGICQGSSTLYYCALYANLKITQRECHYFLVGYLPRGLDATVSWGWPEFRFVNDRNYPIKIEAYVSGGELTVRLLGTDEDGSYVKITSDTWEDSEYYYAQTYRHVYDADGNEISSGAEAYSRYHKEEAVAATATPAPTATPTPEADTGGQTEAPPTVTGGDDGGGDTDTDTDTDTGAGDDQEDDVPPPIVTEPDEITEQ